MAIAIDSSAFATTAPSGTTITKSITVGSGSNRVLFVEVIDPARRCTGVTYNGSSMTMIVEYYSGEYPISCWYLINPATATANIVATFGTSGTQGGLGALALTGVDQTNPIHMYGTDGFLNDNTDRGVQLTTTVDGCGVVCFGSMDNGGFVAGDVSSTRIGTQLFYVDGRAGIVRTTTFPQSSAGAIQPIFDGAASSWGRAVTVAFAPAGTTPAPTFVPQVSFIM